MPLSFRLVQGILQLGLELEIFTLQGLRGWWMYPFGRVPLYLFNASSTREA